MLPRLPPTASGRGKAPAGFNSSKLEEGIEQGVAEEIQMEEGDEEQATWHGRLMGLPGVVLRRHTT